MIAPFKGYLLGKTVFHIVVMLFKETKAPPGYKLDPNTHVFTINGSDTTINVEDDPGYLSLAVYKKDKDTGQPVPQGNANLAGAVYRVCTHDQGCCPAGNIRPRGSVDWLCG